MEETKMDEIVIFQEVQMSIRKCGTCCTELATISKHINKQPL